MSCHVAYGCVHEGSVTDGRVAIYLVSFIAYVHSLAFVEGMESLSS